jgi:phosphate transport system substrate-binding protein
MRHLTKFSIVLLLTLGLRGTVATAPAFSPESHRAEQPTPGEPLAIVVNRSNTVEDLSSRELQSVFLGERSHWANGRRITLVMRDPGEPERKTILRDVCGMTEDQLKTHVLRGLFTGEILVSPKILSTPSGVRRFIFNVPGAIGYLRVRDVDASVKVLTIDKLPPSDKDYKLHVLPQGVN